MYHDAKTQNILTANYIYGDVLALKQSTLVALAKRHATNQYMLRGLFGWSANLPNIFSLQCTCLVYEPLLDRLDSNGFIFTS